MNSRHGSRARVLLTLWLAGESLAWFKRPLQHVALRDSLAIRAGSGLSSHEVGACETPSPVMEVFSAAPNRALVLMDCFCSYHGLYLAHKVQSDYPDVALIFTVSNYLGAFLQTTEPDEPRWKAARLPQNQEQIAAWKEKLHGLPLVGVYCESDSGLRDAEMLRQALQVHCQDQPPQLEARRNKFDMNTLVSEAGLATARQKLCASLEEALAFGRVLLDDHCAVVVKPIRGVASESVRLCHDAIQIEEAWNQIIGTNMFASSERHSSVLIQECLVGTEYAVDIVARDGEYKVAAVWKYDKRPANGAPFCYFRTQLVDSQTDSNVSSVVDYAVAALKALGVRWGLSHNEVIMTKDRGPTLVEVNCRQHNMDFLAIAMACVGYNALDITLMALLDDDEWNAIPQFPTLRAHGSMVHLVNYANGTVEDVRHLEDLSALSSVVDWEVYDDFRHGQTVKPTIDIRTDAGWVQLVNEDPDKQEQDYQAILNWMPTMFRVREDGA